MKRSSMRSLWFVALVLVMGVLMCWGTQIRHGAAHTGPVFQHSTHPGQPNGSCVQPPANLTAWWPAEGNGNDIQGNNTATLSGITFVSGEVGQAFKFGGSQSSFVNVPASSSIDIGNSSGTGSTIDMWINPTSNDINAGSRPLAEYNNGSSVGMHFYLNINGSIQVSAGALFANLVDTSGTNHFIGSSGGQVGTDTWQHVAVTYDKASGNATLYVNGNVVAGPNNVGSNLTLQTTYPLYLGIRPQATVGPYSGAEDEIELFNRALTQTEIQSIFNAGSAGKCHTCTPPPAGLVSWWPGDGNGFDIRDGNDLNLGPATFVPGEVNQAFSFNGSGFATAGQPSNLMNIGGQVTIDGWINPSTVIQSIYFGKSQGGHNDYTIGSLHSDFELTGIIKTGGTEKEVNGPPLPLNTWSHVALTYDGTTETLYLNGVAVSTNAASGTIDNDGVDFTIGGRPGNDLNFTGLIDEVEVFNRALTPTEIAAIVNAGSAGKCRPTCTPPPSGMVSWWPGNGNANDIQDGNNGTFNGTPAYGTGKVGQAFSFNGTNQYVEIPDSANLDITGAITIDAWINPNDVSNERGIVTKYDEQGQRSYFLDISNGTCRFDVQNQDLGTFRIVDAPNPIPTGVFTHVAGTFDPTTQETKIYINGVDVQATLENGSSTVSAIGASPNTPVEIGWFFNGAGEYFSGIIDEVEVFNRALSASEILAIVNSNSFGKCCSITCPSDIVVSNDQGQCTAVVSYITPTTSGTCNTMCSPASGAAFPKGTTTVNCTTTPGTHCSFTITVNDTQLPTVTCPSNITQSTDPDQCTAVVTYTATASDNCDGTLTPTCSPASGTTFSKGTTTVTCTATDSSNNSNSCPFTVTVNDNQPPSITCPSPITQNTDPGMCTTVVTFADPVATDNCLPCNAVQKASQGPHTEVQVGCPVVCDPASGSTFQKGVTTVTCTATDASNNTAHCSFTVTVNDNQNPTVTCPNPIVTNTASGQCNAVVTYTTPTANDNCPGATVACLPASGSTFNKGVTTVTCTATDTSNNTGSCQFTVTVNDNQNPTVTCPSNVVKNTDSGQCSAVVTYTNATANDNCDGSLTPTCTPASGTTFQKGTTTVTCSATDSSSNTGNCHFTVTVNDNQAPVVSCPGNVVKNTDSGQCSAVVTYTAATANDNCDGTLTPTCSPASGTSFNKGVTTVTCTATDSSNNAGHCSFTVTVNDNQSPTVSCPNPIVTNTASGRCDATVTFTTPTANDNCPGATVACSPSSGSVFPKGVTTVTCTATDTSSNTGSCTFTVTVSDHEKPSITCPNNITVAGTTCQTVTYTTPTPSDNCPGATASCLPASGTCFPVGTTTVTCTAMDTSENTNSCTFTVSVVPCTITCPGDQTATTGAGASQCGTNVSYPAPTATAGCGTVTCSPASGSFFPVGMTTVTCTTGSGQSCQFKVTVTDNTPPVISCAANVSTSIAATCPFGTSKVFSYPAPTASDNCGSVTVACAPASGSTFPLGVTTVTCTATDGSSNHSTCSFTVSVYSFCLQDDSSSQNVVFVNAVTGDYLFCSNGVTVASGRGTSLVHGCSFQVDHTKGDRKVHIQGDTSVNGSAGSGTAYIQKSGGTFVLQITDKKMSNDTCMCLPPAQG